MFLRLLEEWRANLHQKKIIRAVLLDLSKAFDYNPHELLIVKLNVMDLIGKEGN